MDCENRTFGIIITNAHTAHGNWRLHPNNLQPTSLFSKSSLLSVFPKELFYFSVRIIWCWNPSDFHIPRTSNLTNSAVWRMSLVQSSVSYGYYSSFFWRFLSHPQFLILPPSNKLIFPATMLCIQKNIQICCLLLACLNKRETNSFEISFSARLLLLFIAGSCFVWFRNRNVV